MKGFGLVHFGVDGSPKPKRTSKRVVWDYHIPNRGRRTCGRRKICENFASNNERFSRRWIIEIGVLPRLGSIVRHVFAHEVPWNSPTFEISHVFIFVHRRRQNTISELLSSLKFNRRTFMTNLYFSFRLWSILHLFRVHIRIHIANYYFIDSVK